MFSKRLSIALCATMCFGTLLFGNNPESSVNTKPVEEENSWMEAEFMDFSLSATKPTCKGDNDAKITVDIDPTLTGPFKVEYKLEGTSSFIPGVPSVMSHQITIPVSVGLPEGKYEVSVQDLGTGDFDIKSISITDNSELTLTPSIDPIDCSTETGKITLIASGGDGSYNYTLSLSGSPISPDGGGNVFSGLAEGSYIAKVIDGNGCPETESDLSIVIPEPISPNVIEGTIDCPGGTTTIELTNLPSDASSYQIKLDGSTPRFLVVNGSTATISDVSAGSHNLTIERPGCSGDKWPSSGSRTVDIEDYEPIGFSWATNPVTDNISVDCYDDETTLTVTLTGGKAGETVELYLKDRVTSSEIPLNSSLPINDPYDFNVKKGEYSLIARIPSCSYEETQEFNIGGPSVPFEITSIEKTEISCPGGTGALKVNYTGGTGQVEYSYNENSFQDLPSNNTIPSLGEGSYSVVLRHSVVCESESFPPVSLEEPSEITVSLDVTQPLSCPGGDNGILTATTSGGGDGGYRYTLLDSDGNVVPDYDDISGSATYQFTGLTAGSYEVDVHTAGCSDNKTDQEEILSIDEVTIEFDYNPALCNNELVEEFHVTASGGDGSLFTYTLKETDGTPHSESPLTETVSGAGVIFHDLEPGNTYRVEASYGSCDPVIKDDITIQNPSPLNVNYQPLIELDCYGGNTDIVIKASGEPPFEISEGDDSNYVPFNSITGNEYKHTLTGKTRGTYTYYIKDANECVYNDGRAISINVTQPDEIFVDVINTPQVKCYGEADAEVELEITGGTSGYEVILTGTSGNVFTESSLQGNIVVKNLPADTYDLQVTDSKGCQLSAPITGIVVREPAQALTFKTIVGEPMLKCYGDSTLVTVDNITGGWPGTYSINISGGNGINKDLPVGENSIYLKKGRYTVTVTDNINGCEATEEIEIEQPPLFKIVGYITHEDVSCNGASDASITFKVTGGTAPYYWGIDDIATKEIASDTYTITNLDYELSAGTYTLYLADDNGCTIEGEEVEIEEPDPVEFEITKVDSVVCSGEENGRIIVEAKGGTGSFMYSLSGEMTRAGQASNEFKNLRAGNYTVHVEDTNGCNAEDQQKTVYEPKLIVFDADPIITKQITCAGEIDAEITIFASGGEPYSLEYMVKGTNMSTSYGENHVIGNLDDGSYSVYVRDNRGKCETKWTALVEVIDPEPLVLLEPEITQVSCHNMQDGEVKLVADGGQGETRFYLYKVTPTDTSLIAGPKPIGEFSDLGEQSDRESISTRYLVVVNDENDCEAQRFFNIINPPKLEILGWEKFDALCHNDRNGSIDLTIVGGTIESDYTITDLLSPGLTYNVEKITDNNYIIKDLGSANPAGTKYQPVVTDDNGCFVEFEEPVLIGNPEQVEYEVTIDNALCHGDIDDKIIIHATGGTGTFYYSLDGGNTYGALGESSFVNEPEGLKKPYVKDENGCVSPNVWPEFLYEEPKPLEVRFTKQGIMCWEDEFGNVVLDIEGGTGDYFLSVKDDNFEATPYFSNPYTITRAREDITTYDLYNDGNIELPEREEFYLFLKDENGCRVQSINDDNEGVISIHKPVFSTTFERPDPLVLLEDPMPYPVTCAGDRTGRIGFKVEGGTFPNFVFTATKQQDPHQGSGQEFNGAVNSSGRGEIEKLYSGIYRCVVTDQHGCQAHTPDMVEIDYVDVEIDAEFDSISVVIYDTIQPVCDSKSNGELHINVLNYMDMGVDVRLEKFNQGSEIFQIHKDDTITYTAEDGDIIFNPEVDFSTYEVHQQLLAERLGIGLYQVIAQDRRSTCTDTVVFNLSSEFGVDCPMVSYYNWFSPHSGNQENDEWEIIETEYEDYLLQIYTSYGELVYSDKGNSDVENIKWDGLDDNGMPAPVGTYIYILQKSNGVRDTIINGNVSIIRNVYK